jgi:DNA invertase Pin-like site-specific DNA recombinase
MKIAIYARVSTTDKQQIDNQLDALKEWAIRLSGPTQPEMSFYVDHVSGSKADRPQLKKLLEDAHKRKFDTLLIWALDRLSREGIAQMATYLETLKSYGVRVLSHQEPWMDTGGPVAELLVAIFAWCAKQERQRFRERIKAGLATARKKGKKLGRPNKVFEMELAFALKDKGESVRSIAQKLGVSKSTISRYLGEASG